MHLSLLFFFAIHGNILAQYRFYSELEPRMLKREDGQEKLTKRTVENHIQEEVIFQNPDRMNC